MHRFTIKTPEDMGEFGVSLGKICEPGDIVCLAGDLGAGKTTLTQSISRGCGISEKEYVSSPTYALFHRYEGPMVVYHMDFYRLTSSDEVLENGLDEYFFKNGLCVVEWYTIAADLLPDEYLIVDIQITGESSRLVTCKGKGVKWQCKIKQLHNLRSTP